MLFFIGLLVGTVPLIYSKAGIKDLAISLGLGDGHFEIDLLMLAFVVLVLSSSGTLVAEIDPVDVLGNMTFFMAVYVFIAGVINGATLVIPGLSGALILLLMGLYPLIIYSVSSVGDIFSGRLEITTAIGMVLIPFGIGALIGNLSMARLMEKLMRDHSEAVHAVILGFLLGSVILLLNNPIVYRSGVGTVSLVFGLFMFVGGFVIAFRVGKKSFSIDN
jgi:putative membrane protein